MTYTYAYKTSDGIRHEATMDASSREDVFSSLRARGIRAIKVVAADGSKANGEIVQNGVRKRVVAALVLGVALVAGVLAFWLGRSERSAQPYDIFVTSQMRRQVIGDSAIIEKGIRTGWSDVFTSEGDRFLASFAIPGATPAIGTTSIEALENCLSTAHNSSPITHNSLESRQIIAMVDGMKAEARAYLASGGSLVEYGKRLTERQDAEIAIRRRIEAEVIAAQDTMDEPDLLRLYETRNAELRALGLRTIAQPE